MSVDIVAGHLPSGYPIAKYMGVKYFELPNLYFSAELLRKRTGLILLWV